MVCAVEHLQTVPSWVPTRKTSAWLPWKSRHKQPAGLQDTELINIKLPGSQVGLTP